MADVFISYARADRGFAALLAGAFERRGLAVWWDRDIPVGQSYSEVIEKALDGANCVVVLWSSASIESEWVKTEADEGARRKILVPVLIQDVRLPFEFRRLHAARLFDANAIESPEFEACLSAIRARLQSSQPGIVDAPSKPHIAQSAKATAPASHTPAKVAVTPLPPLPRRFRHHVLFSYASVDTEYVHNVHAALPEEVKVFDYAEEGIWGEELAKALEHRYKNEALFCVVFISEAYLKSPWTSKELAIVRRVAKRKPGYMLPVLLDGTKVPEIEKIAWLDKTLTPEQLAARIVAKIREPPPKPWWFYLSMEVKVAIAAVLIALVVFARPIINHFLPSRTLLKSVQADANAITAHVINSGPKGATLVGQRLQFGALPIKHAELRLENPASGTITPGEHDVKLIVRELLPECDGDGNRLNNAEIVPLLSTHEVKLEVDVQESDDAPGHSSKQAKPIPTEGLKLFVGKWVPSRVPPCQSPGLRSSRRLHGAGTNDLPRRRTHYG